MNKIQDATSVNQVYDLMNAVRILTRSSLLFQNAIAEKMGLIVTDAESIDFLMEMGSSTAGDLAKVTRLTTGAITSVIDRLEKAGFVRREKDPKDRRKVIVVLIPGRTEEKKKYYESFADDVFSLFSGYTREDLRFLITHTSALNNIYQAHMQKVMEK